MGGHERKVSDSVGVHHSPLLWNANEMRRVFAPYQTATIITGETGRRAEHARGPFSAVRATWKLTRDVFSSSRGALQDPHHEKAPNAKNPAAVGRRRAAGPLPPWGAARLVAFSMAPRSCFPHGMQTQGNPLSFRLSLSGRP